MELRNLCYHCCCSCSIVITTPLDSIKTQLHIQSWIFTKYFRSHLWATFWHLCVEI
ncbi:hypothetical protein HanHA300_Chr15g0580561 [Helianthus annuus]|nr:hypothetical protein HanHA300_Chr15g0580561 [Helianthus annuus]KAJ0474491.1 hypothetical protein HanHA89_Chr15g0630281 [Helianthus annuus]KAJ0650047.1 hypothetical protein HanLR1_Chr15g0591191 [Helianthus annuus]